MNARRKPRRSRANANLRAASGAPTQPYFVQVSFDYPNDRGQPRQRSLVACLHLPTSDSFADEQLAEPLRAMIAELHAADPSWADGANGADVFVDWMCPVPSDSCLIHEEDSSRPHSDQDNPGVGITLCRRLTPDSFAAEEVNEPLFRLGLPEVEGKGKRKGGKTQQRQEAQASAVQMVKEAIASDSTPKRK